MTDYGLIVKNTKEQLQIDSQYINFSLKEHGENVATVNNGYGTYTKSVSFSQAFKDPPLLAMKPSSVYCGVSHFTRSGDLYTGFVIASQYNTQAVIDWMVFIPRKDRSSDEYGMRVFTAKQSLVFDAGHSPMVILDVKNASTSYSSTTTITHPSDPKAYFIVMPSGSWQTIGEWNGYVSTMRVYGSMISYQGPAQLGFGGVQFAQGQIPAPIESSKGFWPNPWTIIMVRKAF